ncbi:MAG: hypothetical protein IV090_21425 [Candidatus Sericytochromatia bacterium]|nr:hypothetical protein [Candidatus Sericytochromatia bacterium]
MSQKVYSRQIKMPRPMHRAVTAEDIKSAAQKDLQPGEQLIRVAFVGMEGDYLVIEAGFSGGKGPEPTEPAPDSASASSSATQSGQVSKTPPPASGGFKAGQIRSIGPRPPKP